MTAEQLKEIISQMTLEEKAAMCSGDDFWHTKAVERLGVPRSMVSDGPHGLRKQDQSGDHLVLMTVFGPLLFSDSLRNGGKL